MNGLTELHEILDMIEAYLLVGEHGLACEQARLLRAGAGALLAELEDALADASREEG